MTISIKLYGDLGFDNTYNHVMDFASIEARNQWFNSKSYTLIQNANYNKLQNELYLEMSLQEAQSYTYCVLTVEGKVYYNFIYSSTLVNERTVAIKLEIDVWQTYLYDNNGNTGFSLGESFIVRKHKDRWTKTSLNPARVTPNVESVQGFETIESDYKICEEVTYKPTTEDALVGYCIISYIATINDNTEFRYIALPINITDKTDRILIDCLGGLIYKSLSLQDILDGVLEETLNIDTDRILSISYMPTMIGVGLRPTGQTQIIDGVEHKAYCLSIGTRDVYGTFIIDGNNNPTGYAYFSITNFISEINEYVNNKTITTGVNKPSNDTYSQTHEPALYIYPIRSIYICDNKGNKIIKVDEDVTEMNKNVTFYFKTIITPTACYIVISTINRFDISASKNQIAIFTMPLFDITTNNWLSYKLTQRNTDHEMIQQQFIQSALNSALSTLSFGAMMKSSVFGNAATSANIGPSMGVLAGSGLLQAISNNYFANRSQDLKERQIQNNPNVLALHGEMNLDLALNQTCPKIVKMRIDNFMFTIMANEYHKYGYQVNEVGIPDYKTRKNYDYIQTSMCKVNGSMNMNIKHTLESIFNKGVTIWHMDYTTTIGDYSKENIERSLL